MSRLDPRRYDKIECPGIQGLGRHGACLVVQQRRVIGVSGQCRCRFRGYPCGRDHKNVGDHRWHAACAPNLVHDVLSSCAVGMERVNEMTSGTLLPMALVVVFHACAIKGLPLLIHPAHHSKPSALRQRKYGMFLLSCYWPKAENAGGLGVEPPTVGAKDLSPVQPPDRRFSPARPRSFTPLRSVQSLP